MTLSQELGVTSELLNELLIEGKVKYHILVYSKLVRNVPGILWASILCTSII